MPRPSPLMVLLIGLSLGLVLPAEAATRGYTITSFDAIRVDAPVTVVVTTGSGASARAEGDQAALDRLKVDVSGRLLIISMARPRSGEKSGGAATLRLSTGMIDRIMLTGGGSVMVDRMKGLQGQIVLGGNGDVGVADVALDRIDVALAGGGRATLGGRTGVANIRVNGPGAVAAEGLRARQASISNDGPGSVTLTAEVTAKVVSTGSGDVTVGGKPACTIDNRGTGRILCDGENY
ncbi:head GIN domain-containing protein [Sphingobium sp. Ant17]|uniref:head GIN domain-containing protein n=1 Tax=Sphingobium sp. Ant17 TaxID=1461752 RepID=UPI0005BE6B91|nr:head GIN domain-containing protein [Sphingobium sp. Ant17]